MAWLGESAGLAFLIFAFMPFFKYLIGSFWLFIYIAEDIKSDLIAFNDNVASKTATTTATPNAQNRIELLDQFCAVAKVYEDAKG